MVGPGGPGNPQFSGQVLLSLPMKLANVISSGFEMTNNCKLISQNGITDDNNQVCAGDYFDGASVTCNDSGNPIIAVDTTGNSYTCSETEDTSCNETSGQTTFTVVACCSRN